MGPGFLIDTNAAVDFLRAELPAAGYEWLRLVLREERHVLSVITRIELLAWSAPDRQMAIVEAFVEVSPVLPLDEEIIRQTIRLRRLHKKKLPDTMIAATALVHGLPLVTRNVADFKAIAGLQLLNPHEPESLPAVG